MDNDNTQNDEIRGKPLYYKTFQVATIIGESESTVRYWSEFFSDILQIETSGRNRQYTEENIEKLKYIKRLLREEKMTLNQVKEYCSKEINEVEKSVIQSEPLAIQALASAVVSSSEIKLNLLREQIVNELRDEFKKEFKELAMTLISLQKEHNDNLNNQLADNFHKISENVENSIGKIDILSRAVDEKLMANQELYKENEMKLNQQITNIANKLNEQEQQANKRDSDLIEKMREKLEENKKEYIEVVNKKTEKKGLFGLFKK